MMCHDPDWKYFGQEPLWHLSKNKNGFWSINLDRFYFDMNGETALDTLFTTTVETYQI